ncbi:PIF1 family ATP-dependent DNA helicase [Neolewinella lacunae]|uniref:AAA family ATPase n=1 Tax=Neolewinella lacunae TaxID=1517758 RepID=A0A923PL38_9BACT|nr:PIF1 family ATP-dependent DNA helicase [Neolewinella lacunae]MBC6996143.1 AAA family ATPase [Neolewinella lacunae]MDN3633995.1 PIF1 family ATP-dependent DNA helicase [Neolewinella lacunae]
MSTSPGLEPLHLSSEFNYALERMEAGANLFITGRAGTGKSTLLQIFRRSTAKNVVVLAPTGVAALNVQGQTIHSLFGFPPRLLQSKDIRPNRRYKRLFTNLETLVIDEISMVRADVMEGIDYALKLNRGNSLPFGGVQVILFGDLFQLPPVVSSEEERQYFSYQFASPYFFSAACLDHIDLEMIELQQVYRQDSRYFLGLLEAIRNATVDYDELTALNERYEAGFQPEAGVPYLTLAARNATVTDINSNALAQLETPEMLYLAQVKGNFPESLFPVPAALKLKVGAQVMTLRNDNDKQYVNGTIGTVVECKTESVIIEVKESGPPRQIEVGYEEWDIIRYTSEGADITKIGTETLGTYRQIPVRLAWAVTIHKSQGKTFDRIIIDLGRGAFEHGQTYVALSRCRTLEGIVLRSPLTPRDVMVDPAVVEFYETMRR